MSAAEARSGERVEATQMGAEKLLENLVFAHDNPFHRAPDGRVYSSRGSWPWERYLAFSRHLTVVSRMTELAPDEDVDRLELSSHPAVSFVGVPSLSGPLARFTHRRQARRELARAIGAADALVSRLPSEIGSLAVDVAGDLRKPWAVELVTCTWDALWNYGSWQGRVYAPYSWAALKARVRRSPFVLYVTKEFLQRRYPSRGVAVGCSDVELPPGDPRVLEERLERLRRGAAGPLVLGTIAALSLRFKGIQTALEALRLARHELPPFELRILGAGDPAPWRAEAARLGLEQEVVFAGTLPPGPAVAEWLDEVDLYLQPSFQEGLPRATLEAMSRACPALGSTAGGIPELLDRQSLHRPGDAPALAALIVRAARDADWRAAQARRNFETAQLYTQPVLDETRRAFWEAFARSAHPLAA